MANLRPQLKQEAKSHTCSDVQRGGDGFLLLSIPLRRRNLRPVLPILLASLSYKERLSPTKRSETSLHSINILQQR